MGKGRKPKKTKSDQESGVFHVEVITKARVIASKKRKDKEKKHAAKWEYCVKWANYESDANSWEPEGNLTGCGRLLESFWTEIGQDDQDYPVGYEVEPSDDWISNEKAYFSKEYHHARAERNRQGKESSKLKKKAHDVAENSSQGSNETRHISNKETASIKSGTPIHIMNPEMDADISSDDDRPLQQTFLKLKIPATSGMKKRVLVWSSEEESSNTRPHKILKNDTSDFIANKTPEMPSAKLSPTTLFSEPSSPEPPLVTKLPRNSSTPSVPEAKISLASKFPLRPSHQQANAGLNTSVGPSASGISTKQRLAQGALAPTLPKALGPIQKIKPVPSRLPSSTLPNLNFKKTIADSTIPMQDSLANSSLRFQSKPSNSPPIHGLPSALRNKFASQNSPSLLPPAPRNIVDSFLQDIMPQELAAPLVPPPEHPAEIAPPKALSSKLSLPGRLPKVWKWTGALSIKPKEASICNVKVHNATKEIGFKFSIIFDQMSKIDIKSFYDLIDIRAITSIFQSPPQFAQMGPADEGDSSSFNIIVAHMEKHKKVFLTPMVLDNSVVGQILYFPYAFRFDVIGMDVPQEFAQTTGRLVAALMPYTLSQDQLNLCVRSSMEQPQPLEQNLDRERWPRSLRTKPKYHHGLRFLRFPAILHKYLAEQPADRTVCLWFDNESKSAGLEVNLLTSILEQTRSKYITCKADARIVFVHIGSLETVHKFPNLVERRMKSFIRFYTFGSHEDVHQSLWGVKNIYVNGGIMTFTPYAMLKDPNLVRFKISQISKHPFWACYILPSALGLLAKLECGDEDPIAMFEKGTFMMDMILHEIAEGTVALLQAPPHKQWDVTTDEDWNQKHLSLIPPSKREALEMGIKAFLGTFKSTGVQSRLAMEEEIVKDMSSMQLQKAFMQYRRFVVICEERTTAHPNYGTHGLEWTTASQFDFMDDYFPKQNIGK